MKNNFGEVVLVGGDSRPEILVKLEQGLGTKVHWVKTSPKGSALRLEETIRQPKVGVVCLLIRWTRHKFGAVKQICQHHQKEFVRLDAGYNAKQILHQIAMQCSKKLEQKQKGQK